MKTKLLALGLWLMAFTSQASAQLLSPDSCLLTPSIKDVFKQMPDSLMPYLTQNNRLDFIDFMESNMKAEVSNLTGGTSEMTALTDDSLSIRMSEALRVDMLLLDLDEPVDSIRQVIVFVETFLADSVYGESVCKTYSVDWQPVTKDIYLHRVFHGIRLLRLIGNTIYREIGFIRTPITVQVIYL